MKDLLTLLAEGEREEHKELLKTSPSTEEVLYKLIKRYQLNLSKEEQDSLCDELANKLRVFQHKIFQIEDCRQAIFMQRYERVNSEGYNTPSLAKLSAKYNSSIRGHNQKLADDIESHLQDAIQSEDEQQAVNSLLAADLSPTVYFNNDIFSILEVDYSQTAQDALQLREEIQKIRENLVRCVLMAIAKIASDKAEGIRIHKGFNSPTITSVSFADVMQEGIIIAFEYTLVYDRENKARWSSYAFSNVKAKLSDFISENTRIVSVPRTLVDRARPVIKAINLIGSNDYEAVALLANKINAEQKQSSVQRKLNRKELYTVEEIEKLVPIIQNTSEMSIDITVTDTEEGNREMTIGDLLGVSEDPIYDDVETKLIRDKLRRYLPTTMSPEHWEVLKIRWGFDDGVARGLDETTHVYKSRFPDKKMNKGKVKEIEVQVLENLRNKSSHILKDLHEASEEIIDRRSSHSTYVGE